MDTFIVDVESDYDMLKNVKIDIEIVPHMIPVQAFNFSVKEGLSRKINAEVLNISHSFYSSKNIEFLLEGPPQHGDIRYQDGYPLIYFSWREVCKWNMYKSIVVISIQSTGIVEWVKKNIYPFCFTFFCFCVY